MTSTEKDSAEFDFGAFVAKHQKNLVRAGGAVVVVGLGAWFVMASSSRKAQNAEQAYVSAERSYYSGNAQLAESDLAKVIDRYGNTAAGIRASILLAKHYYEASKPAEGVAALKTALGRGAAKPFRPALNSLIAGGFEAEGKLDSAGVAYEAAASEAISQTEKEQYQGYAGRAYMAAGKKAEALRIWQALAARETSPLANEAKLRIGELSAVAAR